MMQGLNQPPNGQPPMNQPPMRQPNLSQPQMQHPPMGQPPMSQPPMNQPPMNQPPMSQPPMSQPPMSQPPSNQRLNQFPPQPNQPPNPNMFNNQPLGNYNHPNSNPNQHANPSLQIRDLLKEQKTLISPEGWFINEPDLDFVRHIPGRQPPTPRENCSTEIMRSTLTACPESESLLKSARLPFGLLMQPYRDVSSLSVITTHKEIVRCQRCRMYINPFVSFVNQQQWRCNMCNRLNEVPNHFLQKLGSTRIDPNTGQHLQEYDYPETRPEINTSTIEFIAPQQYSTRPPPPVRYVYLLDVSNSAVATGYIKAFATSLKNNLETIKAKHDTRLQISFIFFNQSLHFFEVVENAGIKHLIVPDFNDEGETPSNVDLEDILPRPENLLINVHEHETEIVQFLDNLPEYFHQHNTNAGRALGPAVEAACNLLKVTGGRTSIFLGGIPTCGYGKLKHRNDSNHVDKKSGKIKNLHSATDIYKSIALRCNGNQKDSIQMGIDTFFISGQYSDISTISNLSRWSSGSIFYYPSLHFQHDVACFNKFGKDLDRYFTRKIGFEAVLRIRMTEGIKIKNFHGNAFVRGEDILSLANVNPDAGFSVNLEIDEELVKHRFVTFQMALLYTNSRGERRVRVHTMTMPVARR